MNPFPQNSSVLVTGAAGGIGKSIAFLFAVHYKKLYLLDLDATKLTELESELLSRFPEISITLFAGSVCDNEFIDHCFSMIEADPYEFS
ncbi:polysaccharide biosynthesis protein, partial [Synechococcus sp. AH-229-G18]|nr:polysaccharide biosynthesis protein [Synechococcus sp. AH-229-G18]